MNVVTSASLLIAVGAALMWVRSYRFIDQWDYTRALSQNRFLSLDGNTQHGCIGFGLQVISYNQDLPEDVLRPERPWTQNEITSGRLTTSIRFALKELVEFHADWGRNVEMTLDGRAWLDSSRGFSILLPFWFVTAIFLAGPALSLRRRRRRLTRLARGLCSNCGYDLRGNERPGRCPECGSPASVPAAPH